MGDSEKQAMKIKLLFLFSSLFFLDVSAQIRGVVTNEAGEPLSFVNVMINDSPRDGATTDLDGRFEIRSGGSVDFLTFSYLGYERRRVSGDTMNFTAFLSIALVSQAYDIAAIEVIAGENPADQVMKKVIAARDRHNPEKLAAYSCKTYNKLHFAWLPQSDKLEKKLAKRDSLDKKESRYFQNVQKFSQSATAHHLFLMESITERKYQKPAQYLETVLHNKVSGFKEAEFVALASQVQPFAFYEEQVTLFDKDFLNPVSPGSPKKYFFHMEDSLYRGADTIFIISYHPRKAKNFDGLKGLLHIHSDGYAIENVKAEPAEDRKLNFIIEQQYVQLEGRQWFPSQLHFGLAWEEYPSPYLGIQASGRSFVSAVAIKAGHPSKTFRSKERVVLQEEALQTPDSIWLANRPERLSPLEEATYVHMDTLGEKHQLDRWWRRAKALSDGRWPLGWVDFSLRRALTFNDFEGFRLGGGLYTSDKLSKHFSIGGYAAYGFKDEKWKYGGDLSIYLNRALDLQVNLFYSHDIQEPGTIVFPLEPDFLTRRFFAQRMSEVEALGVQFEGQVLPFLDVQLGVGQARWSPLVGSNEEEPVTTFPAFTASTFNVHLRYAYGQKYIGILGTKVPDEDSRFPILSLSYVKGVKGFLAGTLNFDKWLASLRYRRYWRGLGESQLYVEAGTVSGEVPLPYLFNSSGIGRDFQWLSIDRVFQTMDFYEFLSDQFVHIFFRHEFGKLLFRTQWLQPAIAVEQNVGVGRLTSDVPEGTSFKHLQKPYLEAGLVVDNIIRINYLNVAWIGLGVGAYYRYGAQHLPGGWTENMGWRFSLTIDY